MGPLQGLRIIEMAGIGPVPLCAMILSDLGAEIIRIDRKVAVDTFSDVERQFDIVNRGRSSVAVDLKTREGVEIVLALVEQSDAIIEGFRPGVMERLGLGPDTLLKHNPRIVIGRITGWGQDGPLAHAAGHDLNYIAITGALHAIGPKGAKPVPPINFVGDFGGGSMFLAVGVLAGILEAKRSRKGQVVDAAMTDGASILMSMMYGWMSSGFWREERGTNFLDGGAPYYDTYETKDGKFVAVGSIEPAFYDLLRQKLGLTAAEFDDQNAREKWPALKEKITAVFKSKTREEWCALMEGTDVCFAPVLTMAEAFRHPHNVARGTFVNMDGVMQPAPAPRFSRTKAAIQKPPAKRGADTEAVLRRLGFSDDRLGALKASGAI